MNTPVTAGATDQTVYVFIPDSSSTTGAGLTGLVYDSANLVCRYVRTRGTVQTVALATLAAVDSAHSDGGFKEVDATNMEGVYRLDLPDACFSAGVSEVIVHLEGATNMAPVTTRISIDPPTDVKRVSGTAQTANDNGADINSILATVNHASYGNAQLVRSTTPANTLDVSATGEAGLDFDKIKDATGAHTLTNITVPTATNLTNAPTNGDLTATMKASINAECDTALSDYGANTVVPDAAGTAPTAAEIKTAMEAADGDLDRLMVAMVNKMIITEANGNTELFDDSNTTKGSVNTAFTSDGTYTTRLRIAI